MSKRKTAPRPPTTGGAITPRSLAIEDWPLTKIKRWTDDQGNVKNPRDNAEAVAVVARSLAEYGWQHNLVVDRDGVLIIGDTRYLAALQLGWTHAPVHVATELTPQQILGLRIMDNKSGEKAQWAFERLALNFDEMEAAGGFDLELTGFSLGEIQTIRDEWRRTEEQESFEDREPTTEETGTRLDFSEVEIALRIPKDKLTQAFEDAAKEIAARFGARWIMRGVKAET